MSRSFFLQAFGLDSKFQTSDNFLKILILLKHDEQRRFLALRFNRSTWPPLRQYHVIGITALCLRSCEVRSPHKSFSEAIKHFHCRIV